MDFNLNLKNPFILKGFKMEPFKPFLEQKLKVIFFLSENWKFLIAVSGLCCREWKEIH